MVIKILYFEPFSGISGDMALGALLDLGIDKQEFFSELDKLGLKDEYNIIIEKSVKRGITGTRVEIKPTFNEAKEIELESEHGNNHDNEHHHNHKHPHDHGHHHGHDHNHDHGIENQHTQSCAHHHASKVVSSEPKRDNIKRSHHEHEFLSRRYVNIKEYITKSTLQEKVKEFSIAIFEKLAIAEAKIHGVSVENVTFHEVGAIDSIVDIVGVAICLYLLGADKILVTNINVGGGSVKTQHGVLPVPAPATIELLKNIPIYSSGMYGELTTPTGAAILGSLCETSYSFPAMSVEKIGYGLGKRDYPFANCLRVVFGETSTSHLKQDEVDVLEANIDDMGGEYFGYIIDKLIAAKALDVWFTPIFMKKNRPAVKLSVLCKAVDKSRLENIILTESTTLGVRSLKCPRVMLNREFKKVTTRYGDVMMKIAKISDDKFKATPEFEDCKKIAQESGVALREVFEEALMQFKNSESEH